MGLRIGGLRLEVAAVLIGVLDPLHVLVQFAGIECSREQVFQDNRARNADRLKVHHGSAQGAVG